MKNIDHKEYEKLTVKEIKEILKSEEFKDFFDFGKVSEGLYKLPGGGYTNQAGWELVEKELKRQIKNLYK